MNQNQFLTTGQLLELFPNLRPFDIDYLVRNRIIPCIKSGRGNPRKFPPEAVKIIQQRIVKTHASE